MVLEYETPEAKKQKDTEKLAKDVLGNDYVNLKISKFALKEDFEREKSVISCNLFINHTQKSQIKGTGVGPIDALYTAMIDKFSGSYASLEDVELVDISIVVKLKEKIRKSGTDAPVTASLVIKNSEDKMLYFSGTSRSINGAAIEAARHSIEFFINSELAVLRLYEDIKDAQKRNRPDIAERNTVILSELVKTTSYVKSINKHKKTLDK